MSDLMKKKLIQHINLSKLQGLHNSINNFDTLFCFRLTYKLMVFDFIILEQIYKIKIALI